MLPDSRNSRNFSSADDSRYTVLEINKNLKFKKRVGIAIKSKETSSKLASYLADDANTTPAG